MGKKILIVENEFIIANILRETLMNGGYGVCGIAGTMEEAIEFIEKQRPEFVLIDIYLKGKFTGIDLAYYLNEIDIPFIYISADANQKVLEAAKVTNPYGFVIKPFREKDVLTALDIAIYRYENNVERGLKQSTLLLQKKATDILVSGANREQKLLLMAKTLQSYIPFEFLSVGFKQKAEDHFYEIGFLRIGFDEYQVIGDAGLMTITNLTMQVLAKLKANCSIAPMATWYSGPELKLLQEQSSYKKLIIETYGLKAHLCLPLPLANNKVGYFNFYSRRSDAYDEGHLLLCNRFQYALSSFMENMFDVEERLPGKSFTGGYAKAPATINNEHNLFEGIVGSSHLLLNVFNQVVQVCKFDSSVLILGESGTGKEKIAERIHSLSLRKENPFIRVNCAALPASLIDSELFGHEKGAFTGAYEKKLGRFERAHTGTIFLDEIGELPMESQSKLLRVLQEKEIERIGGKGPIKIDVRIITATNRNLDKEVAEGRFRLDLFYRINVFPITMPPLRERKEDIAPLAAHFLNIYSRKTGKTVRDISAGILENMKNYHWPGNIRELENLIERNVVITRDDVITSMVLPAMIERTAAITPEEMPIRTMTENERAHILNALKKCNGKIWGTGGAASLLNLPPTTLNSKMRKLGIRKSFGE